MVFRSGDPAVSVQWYRAKKGATPLPFPTRFFSTNWQERASFSDGIGEQPGNRPWVRSDPLDRFSIPSGCRVWQAIWKGGIGAGGSGPPCDSQGIPLCCKAKECLCDNTLIPDKLFVTFSTGVSCPDGLTTYSGYIYKQPDCSFSGYLTGTGIYDPFHVRMVPRSNTPDRFDVFIQATVSILTFNDRSSVDLSVDCSVPSWTWSTLGGTFFNCGFPFGIAIIA
jgi:hypothetical protein